MEVVMSIEAISSSTDIDTEELRVRSLQNIANAALPEPIVPIRKTLSSTDVSSIAPSHAEPSKPKFRPELPAPKKTESPAPAKAAHYMIGILKAHQETERLTDKHTRLFETEVNADIAEIDRLSAEKQEALQAAAKETESRNTWGVLSTVASYIASASAIVLGIACVASGVGSAAGALLIASGGIGLANRVMHDTRGWEAVVSWFTKSEELQIKIAQKIEMGAFFLSLGLGLAGGIWAYSAGAFAAAAETGRQTFMAKAGQIIGLGGAFMGAGSRLGGAIVERRIAHLYARIREIETRMTTNHQTIYQTSSDAEKMIDTTQTIGDEVRKAISASQISFQ